VLAERARAGSIVELLTLWTCLFGLIKPEGYLFAKPDEDNTAY
jgi:hypothetical protein